jgi:hypothetical protein
MKSLFSRIIWFLLLITDNVDVKYLFDDTIYSGSLGNWLNAYASNDDYRITIFNKIIV